MKIILLIMILVSIAFLTLLERKILGSVQLRKGPNKLLIKGVFQPFADGMKLIFKENLINLNCNVFLYNLSPLMMFLLMLMFWLLFDGKKEEMLLHSVMYFILISGLMVYCLFGTGWSSNSKYSLLGSYRSVAQTISYEVSLIFLIMILFMILKSLNFNKYKFNIMISNMNMYMFWIMMLIWVVIMLSELNRAPFDFAESESELVSGFNTELGGGKFVLLFLAEYGSIIFMSYFTMILFYMNFFMLMCLVNMCIIVVIRGSYPRYRYDNLMKLNWIIFLPLILLYMFMYIYIITL